MKIELHGLEVYGYHGVGEEERRTGQRFLFDLELDVAGADEAQRVAEVLAQHVLSNPLIEEFEVEVGAPA